MSLLETYKSRLTIAVVFFPVPVAVAVPTALALVVVDAAMLIPGPSVADCQAPWRLPPVTLGGVVSRRTK